MQVKLSTGKMIPIEMYKVRVVQKANLVPASQRLTAIENAGYNTFLLRTRDVFLDMLTDSGTNAMSDNQLASMMVSDDAYAGGESYYKLLDAVREILGFEFCMPAHQGRAAEHLLAKVFVKPGDQVLMNYHFTTTKAHFELLGGTVHEIYRDGALETTSTNLFKGNIDLSKLEKLIAQHGPKKISFVRMECTTNLIGGQPFSMENLRQVSQLARKNNIPVVIDTSLVSENAYFIKRREKGYADKSILEIVKEMMSYADVTYMSGRKSTCVRGGLLATNDRKIFDRLREWLPVYEGFLTYGGMSSKEVEAMAVGLREMCDIEVASSSADLIEYFVAKMLEAGLPAVTPAGGLGAHVDAMKFLPHVPQSQYTAGSMSAAIYIVSGARPMERGTVSMDRDKNGNDVLSDVELARLAVPRRVYTMAHMDYVVDRLKWLYAHRDLVGGLKFIEEPPVLRFFFGRLAALNDWGTKLTAAFRKDFGDEY
ncbi:MAG: tryptophanase [Phycisphaerales bacterium]|nr:tryptophanase [Phycisphaerales bacterium]